ncbi:MAG: Coenzyme F420 hydrogenase/dehydrogenase, beta subunit C-terminal domain [Candidatus Caldarchaeum sp.]
MNFTKWFKKSVVFSIGLFCSEVFTYSGLTQYLRQNGIDIRDVRKIDIKGKVYVTLNNSETVVKHLKPLQRMKDSRAGFVKTTLLSSPTSGSAALSQPA